MNNFSKNQNVVAAQTTENQYGLLEVSFVCEGGPEFPTALRDGNSSRGKPWSIYDDPLCAFRNGQDTAKYPPQYSYHRANRQVPSWTCRSILFKDGSVYTPEEVAGEITELHKRRIFSASVNEWQYGLKLVEFSGVGLIGGKPIYPTALVTGKSLTDKPLDAFWNGETTANIPFETRETDENVGAVWSAKSIVFADGSAYSKDETARNIIEADKKRIFSASVNEWQYGLKLVEFSGVGLIGGKPIYPTALAEEKSLTDKPLDAFWNGDATTNIPFETRETDENVGAVWSAKSIVFADGSVYSKDETARNIIEADKKRIFSASVNEWQYGLKLVEFSGVGLIGGKPIYPTALAEEKSLTDKPLDAFWNGDATTNIPFETRETDENVGAVWSAKSIVFADGSVYSKDETARDIIDSDKKRIFSVSVNEWQYGLRLVEFSGVGLIGGKPIYPTALAKDKKLTDKPLDAFWGGVDTANIPFETRETDDNIGAVWSAKSIVFADGTPYSKDEQREPGELLESDKKRVFSASVNEWQYGLKLVEFSGVGLIGGKPIYPTALAKDKKLTDKPLDAFWGGVDTANIPFETRETDDNIGAVWSAKSIVFADGTPYSKDEQRESDELLESDKKRVFSASVNEWQYGLKLVEFSGVGLIDGKPIYPTALVSGKSLTDKPLDAFWNGDATTNVPFETRETDDNIGAVWSTKSIVFADGTPYNKNEQRESDELNDSDKLRIYSARVFDAELGLKYVEFRGVGLINGKPIYPTALAEDKKLTDNPLDAFWGGDDAIKLPHSVEISDDNVGVVWVTRVLVNGDGSAISTSGVNELRTYYDIVDYNYPSKAFLSSNGIQEEPGATRKYRAKIVETLVRGDALNASMLTIPYHVKQWAFYYVHGNGGSLYEARSIHGALEGGASSGTSYRGQTVSNLHLSIKSDPDFTTFTEVLSDGMCIDCSVNKAFSDALGSDWYIIRTISILPCAEQGDGQNQGNEQS